MRPPVPSGTVFVKDPVDVWGKEQTIGLAEHAVRTKATSSPYDRRGTLIYWDDFESPSSRYFSETKLYSNGTVARSTDNPKFGDFCLKLTTGSTTNDWVRIYYSVNDFHVGKIGAQFSFATQATHALVCLTMEYYDGSKVWTARLDYNLSTDMLRYYGDDGAYHDLITVPYYKGFAGELIPYSTIKLVADFDNKKYVRSLLFGE